MNKQVQSFSISSRASMILAKMAEDGACSLSCVIETLLKEHDHVLPPEWVANKRLHTIRVSDEQWATLKEASRLEGQTLNDYLSSQLALGLPTD